MISNILMSLPIKNLITHIIFPEEARFPRSWILYCPNRVKTTMFQVIGIIGIFMIYSIPIWIIYL